MNSVNLVGRLVADPIEKTFDDGTSVTNCRIAVRRSVPKSATGDDTDFFSIVLRGPAAKFVSQYLKKGNLAAFSNGELRNREYEKDGVKQRITEILCYKAESVGRPEEGGSNSSGNSGTVSSSASSSSASEVDAFDDELL